MFQSLKNYLVGSYAEMKKVSWPTKEQTINYSLVVIGLSIFMAVFFALLDYGFSFGITSLISR
jgi:preprotein translocase subunit SecE